MSYSKVFCIGLNKTGTTSLEMALRQLGFRHRGWSPKSFRHYINGDHLSLLEEAEEFESFTDWPWPLVARDLLSHYGAEARFILTTRRSSQVWLDSLKAHALTTSPDKQPRRHVFGYDYPQENERAHQAFYEFHNDRMRDLFDYPSRRHQFIELCWETGDGWEELCDFLDRPCPVGAFPHQNRREAASAALIQRNQELLAARLEAHLAAQAAPRSATDKAA